MDYKKKVEYAERIAKELESQHTSEQVTSQLKADGLYERDITNIFISVRNILSERYGAKIKENLLNDKGFEAFNSLDEKMLEQLIEKESQSLTLQERKKLTRLIKEGRTVEQALEQIDNRFLSLEQAKNQMENVHKSINQNSGSARSLSIGGGVALIALTIIILMSTGRLFYVLPIIGIGLIAKGLTTKSMEYDE